MNWLVGGLLLSVVSIWSAAFTLPDQNLHVVVCDVGQGDGILVMRGTTQMLVDSGPDNSILGCLSRHMPFYDHRIEFAVITHPQLDHFGGFSSIVDRYTVAQFASDSFGNTTVSWLKLKAKIKDIPQITLTTGDQIKLDDQVKFGIIWPSAGYTASVETKGLDFNKVAIVGKVTYQDFDMLLTADADSQVELAQMATGLLGPVEVLKVPHHGSKTGMLPSWLEVIKPQLGVISVGKKNRYGHPHPQALDLLSSHQIKTLRTDQNGDVELISDGHKWWYNLQYGDR